MPKFDAMVLAPLLKISSCAIAYRVLWELNCSVVALSRLELLRILLCTDRGVFLSSFFLGHCVGYPLWRLCLFYILISFFLSTKADIYWTEHSSETPSLLKLVTSSLLQSPRILHYLVCIRFACVKSQISTYHVFVIFSGYLSSVYGISSVIWGNGVERKTPGDRGVF